MASGGSRPGAGRPQDPNALDTSRRKDSPGLIVLPSTGRPGDAPEWPLDSPGDRELEMWARFWRKPQAIIWEQLHYVEIVALFVRQFCEGEAKGNSAENRKAIQTYFSVLCLTPPSLKAAGFTIGDVEAEPARRVARKSSRGRLTVVSSGDGA